MALVKSRAVVLRTHMLGETSRIVVCYTRDYGKVRLVAKGVRRGGGSLGAALEPMLVSGVVFYLRQGRDLSLVSQAEVERQWPALRSNIVRMAYAAAVLELTDALVTEHEPDPDLFDLLELTIELAAKVSEEQLDGMLWWFELSVASLLGYAPDLTRCVVCGSATRRRAAFAPLLGGVVCEVCAPQHRAATKTTREAVSILSALACDGRIAGRTRNEFSGGPPESWLWAAALASVGVRDELSESLRALLEEHAGRQLRLKSMSFLAQVRRTEPEVGKPE
ncbi:MAG: DNA repair protein RecO [Candidatus Eisenbacteria bacterium]|nr:DNA repair protein RecO [Candidatus Eisenbacteria bacterium]